MTRAVIVELLWLAAALTLTALIFWAGAWSYQQGEMTIWPIGFATMAAIVAMSFYEIRRVTKGGGDMRDK